MLDVLEEKAKGFLKQLFGDTNEKRVQHLQPYVDKANSFDAAMQKLTDEELQGKTAEFKAKIANALKDVEDVKLIPDETPKMPGQMRTKKDMAFSL